MNCHICIENYNIGNRIPKNLSCGHTFCERCLKKLEKISNTIEVECPKCRKKSQYPLSICYAIYDNLLSDHTTEVDDPCINHKYEKLNFYCEDDKTEICLICLRTCHSGHKVCKIKDKIIAEENKIILKKWYQYYAMKSVEKMQYSENLNGLLKILENQKNNIREKLINNYDENCENLLLTKTDIKKEIDDLYIKEYNKLKEIKYNVNSSIFQLSNLLNKIENEDIYKKLNNSTFDDFVLYDTFVDNIREENLKLDEKLKNIITETNIKINYKTINYTNDVILSKNVTQFHTHIQENKVLPHNIIFIGDNRDKTILNFNLKSNQMTIMDSTLGTQYDFLDYTASCKYISDSLLVTGGCIYLGFRYTASKNTYLAKLISNNQIAFSEFKPMSIERFAHGLCVVKSIPYIFGGHNGEEPLDTIEYFDKEKDKWILLPDCKMNIAREIFAYCLMNDKDIYVFGGFNDTHLDSIEKFDVIKKEWKLIDVIMPKGIQNATAVAMNETEIIIIGGFNGYLQKTIDVFNVATEAWSSMEKMKVARRKSHCYRYEDKIFIFGGEGNDVDEHIPELLDLNSMTTSFLPKFDAILYKSMNFWSSTIMS